MAYTVSKDAFVERVFTARQGALCVGGGRHILIACMPKSGSTFLSTAIANVQGMTKVALIPGEQRREHELCPVECAIWHELNYVAQHHVRYSESTQRILTSFKIFPVVLMRNIFDSVISLYDFTLSEYKRYGEKALEGPLDYTPLAFMDWPKEKQIDFIIDFDLPWYANFFGAWSEYRGPCIRLMYDEMIGDFNGALAAVLNGAGYGASPVMIEAALAAARGQQTRFNVGKPGRGAEQLTAAQIARIEAMFSHYSHIDGYKKLMALKEPVQ